VGSEDVGDMLPWSGTDRRLLLVVYFVMQHAACSMHHGAASGVSPFLATGPGRKQIEAIDLQLRDAV
jgi:hypothetical protein